MIEIINGHCMQELKLMDDNSIDIIITSPPYNLKNKGGTYIVDSYIDNVSNERYEQEQIEFLNECYRVLKPTGAMFYNHKNRYENNQIITPYSWVLKSKMKCKQEIIWNRKTTFDFNSAKFAPLDEKIFWLYKENTYRLKKGASIFTNIWEINRPTPKENRGHKATFPFELIYRILISLDTTYEDKTLMDTYMGTGTALQCGRELNFYKLIGIEIDPKWIEVARDKIYTPNGFKEEIPIVKKTYKENQSETVNEKTI